MERVTKPFNNHDFLKISFFVLFLPLLGTMLATTIMHDWRLEHRLAHSLLEISSSIIAILVVLLLYINPASTQLNRMEASCTKAALLSMSVLVIFHVIVTEDSNFIWFSSTATLAGGIFFAGVGLRSSIVNIKPLNLPVMATSIASIAILGFIIWSLFLPTLTPSMVTPEREFSLFARLMNLCGGLGFTVGCVYLYKRYRYTGYRQYLWLSIYCVLLGISGILFEFSYLWGAHWWWQQILQFVASLILAVFFFDSVRKTLLDTITNPQKKESSHDAETSQSYLVPLQLSGCILIFLGLAVLVGWHTHNALLIQVLPQFSPMRYNTGLGFLLSGIGLFALTINRLLPVMLACSGLVSGLGLFTLIQYFFSVDFNIDQFFMEAYIPAETLHPGRMAPNTALCFLLIGLSPLFLVVSKQHRKLKFIGEFVCLLVLVLSILALLGYIQNVGKSYGWGSLTRMAVHTSWGFIVLALSTLYYHHLQQKIRGNQTTLPIWISFSLMTTVLAFDLSSPLGVAAGFAYIPILFCSMWFSTKNITFIFAFILSCLIILGFLAVPYSDVDHDIVLTNRFLSITTIWIIAAIVYLFKLTFKALINNKAQLKLILDNAGVGVYGIDSQGRGVFANKKSGDILGYTQNEILNTPFHDLVINRNSVDGTPYNQEIIKIHATLSDGVTYTGDQDVFWHKNGHPVPIEYTSTPERDQNGNITGAVIVYKDITSRKMSENRIKSALHFKNLVMSNIPHPIFVKDSKSKIVQANSAFINFYPKEMQNKVIGFTTLEQFRTKEKLNFLKYDKQALTEGYAEAEETIHFPDGEKRRFFTRKIRFENEHAERFILAVSHDITDIRKAQDERLALIDKLTNSNEELERFAYVASHDLQEPLRMVTNFTKLLEKRYSEQLDDQAREYIHIASNSAQNMQDLVHDLLEYARIGEETERYEKVNLGETLLIVQENLKEDVIRSRAQIIYHNLPVITTNPIRLMRLMQNLITNALKYQRPDNLPEIRINADLKDGEWIISIADNGIGMKQEYSKKIFEPFKRLHAKHTYAGTGMGLAICRKIVGGLGGRIWAQSEPEKGSTFYFTVPERTTDHIKE